ncbi:MAG: hypothetical protein Ct9H90mP3_2850 [Flammeovirgaceae bacterium]|nr:MAG: hypothetical protein Ct9H90mP3_2850 [Flammeovirgaceae bacterium]
METLPVGDGQKLSVRVQANGSNFKPILLLFQNHGSGQKTNNFSINYSYSVNRMLDFFGTGGYNHTVDRGTVVGGYGVGGWW